MIWEDLDKNLIHLQADAQHANDIFDQLGGCFVKEGYSRSDYVKALKQREAQFPTGLDINGFGVAIPHTDAGYVLHETEGIMTLKQPVTFIQMGSDDTQVLRVDIRLKAGDLSRLRMYRIKHGLSSIR